MTTEEKLKYGPWRLPLEEWPEGWLKLEIANLKRQPLYLIMTDDEKRAAHLPVTTEEMRKYIQSRLGKK